MKKYILWMPVFLLVLLVSGCEREITSGMDGSVAERIDNLIKGYVNELRSSEHGWMVSINTQDGYYRFWMSFHQGDTVIMYTDNTNYDAYKLIPDTSTFAFKALQRPTLIFDTYSYLSYINDPNPNISNAGSSNYMGLGTDFEFEVDKFENGVFYMTGRFNRVGAIFKKATAEDKEGVVAGLMTDLPKTVVDRLNNYYIKASYDGTEFVVKVRNQRLLYTFWYNDIARMGEEKTGYFNAEVDGSEDLFFPEPIKAGNISLTGLKYDKSLKRYTAFSTDKGDLLKATVSFDPPEFPLSKVFGYMESGNLFEKLTYPDGLASSIPGTTSSSLSFMSKGLSSGAFILILSYTLQYYFSDATGTPELIVYFLPTSAIGTSILGGSSWTATYPSAWYRIPVDILDGNILTFKTSNEVKMDTGAEAYYNRNITKELIDNFKNKTFDLKWSKDCRLSRGLIVQFAARETNFAPPAVLLSTQ